MKFILFAIFFNLHAYEIKVLEIKNSPSKKIESQWLNQPFETDEFWQFKSLAQYEELLNKFIFDEKLKIELLHLYQSDLAQLPLEKLIPEYNVDENFGAVLVPQKLRAKLPKLFLNEVYTIQERIGPLLSIKFTDKKNVEDFLSTKIPIELQNKFSNNIFKLGNLYKLVVTPTIWSDLPAENKLELINNKIAERNGSLQVELTVFKNDNLRKIARLFAGFRNEVVIERFLKMKLGKKEKVTFPLQNIMHPFIRKMINQYNPCHGANCYNAGINVNMGKSYKTMFISDPDKLLEVHADSYRYLDVGESLTAGDLLVYKNGEGAIIHISTFIGQGIVFTKNGMTKYSPYIFESKAQNEDFYFPYGDFTLLKLRPIDSDSDCARSLKNFIIDILL